MSASYPKVLFAGLQASYDAIETKDSSKLYFCTDSGKLYKGEIDFTESCRVVETAPNTPVEGILYLVTGTGKAQFYDGTAWQTVSLPSVTSFNDNTADDNHVATTEAIVEYVASVIGGSSDVVKSIAASDPAVAGKFTYTTADDTAHDVTVPLVGKTLAAGASAAQVKLEHTTGTDDTVTVPGVVTGLAADNTDAATVNVTTSTGTHADVVVPKVVTGLAAGSSDGAIAVTLSSGTHADVTVPGVFKDVSWNSSTRVLTFTDTDGDTTHTVNLGKDIFIDQNANNRYENGNIYLYLNDGQTTSEDTEIVIPVTGLITDYFGDDTDTISVSIDGTTHKVTADAVVRPDVAGTFTNALKVSSTAGAKGLYVDLSDVEDSIDALAAAITWGTF